MKASFLTRIFSNGHYSEIIKGAGLAFFLKALGALISFILTLIVAKSLGVKEAGYYFFIVSSLLFLSSISSFGLFNAVLKEASINAGNKEFLSSLMSKSIVMVVGGTLLIGVLFAVYNHFKYLHGISHYIIDSHLVFLFFAILPFTLTFVFSSYFQARRYILLSMLMLNIGYQSLMVVGVTFFSVSTLNGLLVVFLVSISVVVFLAIFFYFYMDRCRFTFSGGMGFSALISLSLPMMAAHVISQVNVFSGQFFLSIYTTPEDISLFSVSLRISTLMAFLVVAVNRISAPKFASLYKEDRIDDLKKVVSFSNRILFLFCVPVLFLVVLYGRHILSFFGEDFVGAYYVLLILTFGQFVSSITGTVVFLLQMTGLQRELRNNVIVAAIVSVFLGFYLIPLFGLIGAAIMTFVSLSITNLFSCYRAYKILGINPLKFF